MHKLEDFAPGTRVEFPLKDEGKVWYTGWDIPGHWAIDANLKIFGDFGAHGCEMRPISVDDLIRELESVDDPAGARIRVLFDRKPQLPSWMASALQSGWAPPSSFSRDDYE